jgi:predicted TIM-barrel fold metal-dependent hydrolase
MNKMTLLAAICLTGCVGPNLRPDLHSPRIASHQHLISPAFALLVGHEPIDASALLRMMDEAGSEWGVVLSMAYSFADERKQLADPEGLVRQENDWTATQVAVAPSRLRGFCSVNPLTPGRWRRSNGAIVYRGWRG